MKTNQSPFDTLPVLVVDDNPANIVSMEALLKRNGFQADMASSGPEALEKMLRNEYGLVLLDVQMPEMDGFEVAEHMKSNKRTKYIPIIFISAFATDKNFFEKGIRLGAVDYITKPFDPDILLLKARNLLYISYTERELIRTKDELKISNSRLAEKASRNRIAFESMFYKSPDLMLLLDKQGILVDCNQTSINFGHLPVHEIIGSHYSKLPFKIDFNGGVDQTKLFEQLWTYDEVPLKDLELTVSSTEQGTLYYELNFIKTYDEQGEELLLLIFKNTTKRKQAELSLLKSEKYYKTLIRDSSEVIAILDKEGEFLFASPGYQDMMGYTPDELLNQPVCDFIYPDDLYGFTEELGKLESSNRIFSSPYRFKTKNGGFRWLQSIATDLTNDPVINGVVINSSDITSLLEIQENLIESEARYRGFYDSQTNFVIRTDLEGNYTYLNKKFETEFAWLYPEGQILGINSLSSIMEYDHPKVFEAVAICIDNPGKVYKVELDKPAKNGEVVTTLWDFVCITDSNGIPVEIQCMGIDITAKRKAEIELQKSKEQYKYLFRNNPAPMFIWDFDSKLIVDCNEAALKLYGYHHEEFIGLSIFAIRPEEDVQKIKEATSDVDAYSKMTANLENTVWRHLNKNGEIIYIEAKAHLLDYEGKTSSLVIINDITQTKISEQKLRDSNERYELINKATKDALYDWDIVNDQLVFGDSFKRVFGEKFKQPSTITEWEEILHPVDKHETSRYLKHFLNETKNSNWIAEYRLVDKDGLYQYVEEIGYVTRTEDGQAIRMVGVIRNITEHKNLQALLEQTSQLAMIGSWEVDLILKSNPKVFYSKIACEIFDIENGLAPAFKDMLSLYTENSKEQLKHATRKLIEKGEGFDLELEIITSSSTRKWIRNIGQAEFINGKCCRIFGSVQDITILKTNEISLKQLNERLKKYTKELETSNAELEQFAYIASHDLQEPLRMISSFLTQLEKKYKDQLDDKAQQYIHYAVDGAKRMRRIILDLLEYSRVGKSSGEVVPVDLNKVVEEVLLLHSKIIQDKKAKITVELLPIVNSSEAPMNQLFNNLIGNALKYQAKDSIPEINIRIKEHLLEYEFSIQDNGIGIEKEYFDKIFIIFQRLHQGDEYSGTGMGLSIVKKILDSIGGKISLQSKPGKGTRFIFTIPKG